MVVTMPSKKDILKQVITIWALTIGIILMTVFNTSLFVGTCEARFIGLTDLVYILTFLVASVLGIVLVIIFTIKYRSL